MKAFSAPHQSVGALDPESAGALIASVSDVALILDSDGVVRDCAFNAEDLAAGFGTGWVGKNWRDVVTVESRPKIEQMLRDAGSPSGARARHVNHPVAEGEDVPVLYTVHRLKRKGMVLACGRDLRTISSLQRRLLDAQQSMERDYARLRQVETRYRLLFELSPEAVVIVDALTQRVVEANPAAARMLDGGEDGRIQDRSFTDAFTGGSQLAVQALLAGVRVAARAETLRAKLAEGRGEVVVSASLFRQENNTYFLVRLGPVGEAAGDLEARLSEKIFRMIEQAPDGFVVVDASGHVLAANQAFLDMAELAAESQAKGERLDRWLGRQGVDLDVLMANLRQHGAVRLFATVLRGEYGARLDVELSATAVGGGAQNDPPCFGFAIRNVDRRLGGERATLALPRSAGQLTELIGRVPLRDLVRESTDMIERLCIEAALEVTGDNRASAAEMLGLSRQSLYVKLRRYGLGDLDDGKE